MRDHSADWQMILWRGNVKRDEAEFICGKTLERCVKLQYGQEQHVPWLFICCMGKVSQYWPLWTWIFNDWLISICSKAVFHHLVLHLWTSDFFSHSDAMMNNEVKTQKQLTLRLSGGCLQPDVWYLLYPLDFNLISKPSWFKTQN